MSEVRWKDVDTTELRKAYPLPAYVGPDVHWPTRHITLGEWIEAGRRLDWPYGVEGARDYIEMVVEDSKAGEAGV